MIPNNSNLMNQLYSSSNTSNTKSNFANLDVPTFLWEFCMEDVKNEYGEVESDDVVWIDRIDRGEMSSSEFIVYCTRYGKVTILDTNTKVIVNAWWTKSSDRVKNYNFSKISERN
jgi:hypothetical protein